METKAIIYIIALILLITGVVGTLWHLNAKDAPRRAAYAELAECLKEKGAEFYGAYWCPHCAQQKSLFGSAQKKLPYIECADRDTQEKTEECKEKKIATYPTWHFKDSTRCTGLVSVEVLAHQSGCALPEYEGKTYTTKSVYEDLLIKKIKRRMAQEEAAGVKDFKENGEKDLAQTEVLVDIQLQTQFNKKIETATIEEMLTILSISLNNCGPQEQEEIEENEGN